MLIWSVVQVVKPGSFCSYPVGRREIEHFSAMGSRTHEQAGEAARVRCETFNRCRSNPRDNSLRYEVEEVDEEGSERAAP